MLQYTGIYPTNFIAQDGKEIVLFFGDVIENMDHPIVNTLKVSGLLVEKEEETKQVKKPKK